MSTTSADVEPQCSQIRQGSHHPYIDFLEVARRMNASTRPCLLPPELLAEVFARLGAYRPGAGRSTAVLIASHVCHHWHEVALHFPHLWYHFELGRRAEYHHMVLERSKDCNLYVSGDAHRCEAAEIERFLGQIHRVYSLEFSVPPPASLVARLRAPPSGMRLSAPRLRFFSEASYYPGCHSELWVSSLFSRLDMPRLQHLELSEFESVLDALTFRPFQELRTLSLRLYSWTNCRKITVDELLAALSHVPTLETLCIRSGNHLITTFASRDIALPQLRKLALCEDELVISAFLQHVATPKLSSSQFIAEIARGPHPPVELLSAATKIVSTVIDASRRQGPSAVPWRLDVARAQGHTVFTGWADDRTVEFMLDNNCHSFTAFENFFQVRVPPSLCASFLRQQLAGPEVGHLGIHGLWDVSECADVLKALNPAIDDVTFTGADLGVVVALLSQDPPLLPQLRTLRLLRCALCFDTEHMAWPPQPANVVLCRRCRCASVSAEFLAALKMRSARGMPVQVLALSSCWWYWTLGQKREFAKVVPDVSQTAYNWLSDSEPLELP
ncbi:F-box protein [Phanerochaete sordida]|uniref:F-box protein n=1 Tax=Phanerochaete sordida TaxID=48140 RepID=A0A9P3LG28_9APHY|nr:F-box protein [Phanerochaete sordida]